MKKNTILLSLLGVAIYFIAVFIKTIGTPAFNITYCIAGIISFIYFTLFMIANKGH